MTYPHHAYDFIQWRPGQRGLYESNYLKANAPDGRRAFWIKYNILAPFAATRPAVAELWAVLFDRDAGPPRVVKEIRPMTAVQVSNETLRFESEGCRLTASEAIGRIAGEGGEAEWTLKLNSTAPPLFHLPYAWMYTLGFPKKKILTPAPCVIFEGTLTVAGRTVEVNRWRGLRGHNWGSEHAYAYAYGNCAEFAEDSSAVLDGFTARIRLGPAISPWLSLAVLRFARHELSFNQPRAWITPSAVVDFPRWQVTFRGADYVLRTSWEAPPETFVGLRYLHPDGKVSYCYNSKFASVRAELIPRTESGRGVTMNGRNGELEFLFPQPLADIPLHGEVSL